VLRWAVEATTMPAATSTTTTIAARDAFDGRRNGPPSPARHRLAAPPGSIVSNGAPA
jgi:hypothetical protein